MEASAAPILPAEIRSLTVIRPFRRQRLTNDPHPPAAARSLQAGGHRFDPGWLHHLGEGRTAPVPAKGAGASATGSRAERVERLLKALMAA